MLRFLFLLLSAVPADAEIRTYGKEGGDVELKPVGAPPSVTSISWKFERDLAAEWDGETLDNYLQFKDRAQLNTSTGVMTLRRLSIADSGHYYPQINLRALDPVVLSVIAAVPVPSINTSCNEDRTVCQMTCEADTAGAEPATYVWRADGQEVQQSKTFKIQKSDSSVKEFSCELRNPVSQEISSPRNPFTTTTTEAPPEAVKSPKIFTGVTVLIVLLVSLVLLGIGHRMKTGSWFFQKDSMPWEADFWRRNERPQRRTAVATDDTPSGKD